MLPNAGSSDQFIQAASVAATAFDAFEYMPQRFAIVNINLLGYPGRARVSSAESWKSVCEQGT
jgi:hypothetical protein